MRYFNVCNHCGGFTHWFLYPPSTMIKQVYLMRMGRMKTKDVMSF